MLIPSFTYVRIGASLYPYRGLAHASQAYMATIERLGLGASETPRCELLDSAKKPLGYISYNGRAWLGDTSNSTCIYDPIKERLRAEYLTLVGYDPFQDCPEITCVEVAALVEGIKKEMRNAL